jgi:hypothetical protein
LTGVISLIFYHEFLVIIQNQCSDFELVSPEYFGRNVIWHTPLDQKVDTNATARASFGRNATEKEFTSVLVYGLQRKECLEYNADNMPIKNASTSFKLLAIWRPDNTYEYSVRVLLIEHGGTTTWDEDELKKLNYQPLTLLRNGYSIKNTWVLDETTVLMTTSKWEMHHTIEITISNGSKEDGSMEPLRVLSNM